MKAQSIVLDKKKYFLIEESEYLGLKEDIADLKKVFERRSENGVEANVFLQIKKTKKKK